ncbi:non-ribosomal peptide synthetase/type I polyketide synthase [Pseudoalteromonas luteoviolacea]|uniref:non-ribosomal peptide synthetase/type I polyketide synthase n=1 Tax=Pseudoalteromonas luteoviolacea TaxID=43657 RepID=UPI0011504B33|nr:non-ribosomal peptide synthetase/type I polyketide synthase [Pseudoalteromonas luteoviolacea]TQF72919.1 amino acid adenylation domain-containing protein [Pseudoalteromonas luteoviolacea]
MKTDLVTALVTLAKTRGDDTAFHYFFSDDQPGKTLSYQQLDYRARQIAAQLSLHFEKGDRALLLYNSGFEFVEAFFACLYAGVVAVPVYPPKKNQNIARLRSIIFDAGAKGVLTSEKVNAIARPLFEAETSLNNLALFATDSIQNEVPKNWQVSHAEPHELAFLQYTSGSTGAPKGVMVSHGNIVDNEEMMKVAFGHDESTPIVSWLPHFHDMGLIFGILQPVYIGATACLMNPTYFLQKPFRWLKLLSEFKGVTSSAPNFAYDLCVDTITEAQLAELDLSHWQSALNGAEPVRASTLERFYQKFKQCGFRRESLAPCYGMAETTLFATGGNILEKPTILCLDSKVMLQNRAQVKTSPADAAFINDGDYYYAVSSGHSWQNHQITIACPETKQRCLDGEIGEIWVKGNSVAKGYWNKPELSTEIFDAYIAGEEDGPYLRTGDLGFLHHQELFVTGRSKDVLIFRGKNYYPQDIELSVSESDPALDANGGAAFSITVGDEERLVIVQQVKRTAIRKLDAESVFANITAAIVEQHGITPYDVLLIKPGRVCKTSSGKIQRQENRKQYLEARFEPLAAHKDKEEVKTQKPAESTGNSSDSQQVRLLKACALLQQVIASEVGVEAASLELDASFLSLGVDSMKAVRISGELMELHGIELESTVLYEYPSINQLAEYLCQFEEVCKALDGVTEVQLNTSVQTGERGTTQGAMPANQAPYQENPKAQSNDIAVIGMACRYPHAESTEALWQLLESGSNAISLPSEARKALGLDINSERLGGYLSDIELFDHALFGIAPSEASHIDPQQRLLLENSYHAIQSAGYVPSTLAGQRVGVYVGISQSDYFSLSQQSQKSHAYLGTGTALSIAANRLSYFYNFTGPSLAIDTACSSSLVALHHAMQAVRSGQIPMAMVSGVNLILSDEVSAACDNAQMLANDGRCKTFSAHANGYVRSEGVGTVLLKPLKQALQDHDVIYGVLKGSAVNQDGRSNGITAPNGRAQQDVIRAALDSAQVSPQQVQYVEAHGTGTELGDPIEVSALQQVYGEKRQGEALWVGSVKANIGHLESAAGLAGLIKTLLCFEHQQVPPQRYVDKLNPHIAWDKFSIKVPSTLASWPKPVNSAAIAGLSSFGFGGTNAHVICASAPVNKHEHAVLCQDPPFYVLPLSAKTASSLARLAKRYGERLADADKQTFNTLVYNCADSLPSTGVKQAFYGTCKEDLLQHLHSLNDPAKLEKQGKSIFNGSALKVVFLFTGQGAQYPDMGKSLYDTQAVFKAAIEECDTLLSEHFEERLLDVLYQGDKAGLIHQARWAQLSVFAVEYALAKLWQSLGIEPDLLISHSVGEYAAACIAEVMSLPACIELLAARAELMQQLPAQGTMVAARCSSEFAQQLIQPFTAEAAISAYHGEAGVVFSGSDQAMGTICQALEQSKIRFKSLNTARAFHSPLMEPVLPQFSQVADKVTFNQPKYKFVSSQTGEVEHTALTTANYWVEQIVQPVRFASCINELSALESFVTLEMGPKPILNALLQENLPRVDALYLNVLNAVGSDNERLAADVASLCEVGYKLNWQHIYPVLQDLQLPRVPLPLYPFEPSRHWISDAKQKSVKQTPASSTAGFESADEDTRRAAILEFVLNTLANELGMLATQIDTRMPLLEMGVDSLMIMRAVRTYEKQFDLEFSVRQFYEELSCVELLVEHVIEHSDYLKVSTVVAQPQHTAAATYNELNELKQPHQTDQGLIASICHAQLQAAASITNEIARQGVETVTAQQLRWLTNQATSDHDLVKSQDEMPILQKSNTSPAASKQPTQTILPGFQQKQLQAVTSSFEVKTHATTLCEHYCEKTSSSKQLVAAHRQHLADCRASAGFRLSSKEMLYPVFAKRCEGSRIWDIDDNEYIDITMDFGVNLFGHKPEFVNAALVAQLDNGMQLGLASPAACEVAELVAELTGLERVTFCNSGTEAVMTAVRLARNKTKRDRIVQFSGSYHGHYDGTLATHAPDGSGVEPMCSGVQAGAISGNLVLDYGEQSALAQIREHAECIAAVLVEPVQSRHPALQPFAFLKQLRELTKELGIALIFDEMITGFRAHPGGVQALLGIQADMATYGKIVGGGLPIGVVAGSAEYLDGIDGGNWQYGDNSYPQADTTFFAGTFCKHPLSMVSAAAVLKEIKRQGPQLQAQLAQKTTYLQTTLNDFFTQHGIPIGVESYTSLFRFTFAQNLDVFFYELLNRGVFIWEGRNCFISAAHSDADIEAIIAAVKASALALKNAGYFSNEQALPEQRSRNTAFALTEAQQQLLALAMRSEQGALAYHLQASVKLSGMVNIDQLNHAVDRVIAEFSILSLGVDIDALTHTERPAPRLEVITLLRLNEAEALQQLTQWRYAPFDFEHQALCRFAIVQAEEEQHYLSIVAHHIVSDGLSLQLIIDRIAAHYNGDAEECEDLPQYADYAFELAAYRQSKLYRADQEFWIDNLADSEALVLPTQQQTFEQNGYGVKQLSLRIPPTVIANISALAKSQSCGLFATLLAGYVVWLHKLSQQQVIAVNVPVSARQLLAKQYDVELLDQKLVGYCTNMMPLVVRVLPQSTFADVIKQVQSQMLHGLDHANFPYSALTNQNLILPTTVFNLDRVTQFPQFHGVELSPVSTHTRYGHFDLNCNILNVGDNWLLELDFNSDKFDEVMMQSYAQAWLSTLAKAQPEQVLSSTAYALLNEDAQRMLVTEQIAKLHSEQSGITLLDMIEEQVFTSAKRIAVQDSDLQLSYEVLHQRSNQLAHYLIQQGIGSESLVAVAMMRSCELLVTLLAILKTGAAYLPLDLTFPQARVRDIVTDSQTDLVLCDAQCSSIQEMLSNGCPCINLDSESESICACNDTVPSRSIAPQQRAYVIYTSGSSGRPKGVEIRHDALANFLQSMARMPRVQSADRMLAVTTVAFDIAALELYLPLVCGAFVYIADDVVCSDPLAITELLDTEQITIMQATPTLWRMLLKASASSVAGLKLLTGGEPLEPNLAETMLRHGAHVFNMYGPTETTIWSSVEQITDANDICIGHGIDNTALFVMPEQAECDSLPLPVGVWGELWIGGVGLANGYLNRAELTQQSFITQHFEGTPIRLYKTGDRARRLPDGRFQLQGRLDNQVKLHGHRIELGEIEYQIRKLIGSDDVRVLVKQDHEGAASLCAYCIEHGELKVQWSYGAIRQHLLMKLPSYMVPEYISWIETWPLTPNGKLDLKALTLPQIEVTPTDVLRLPETPEETQLHAFFSALLPIEKLSTDVSFFDCGGNSVLAMQLISRVNQCFSVRCTVADVFEYPSIQSLAKRLIEIGKGNTSSNPQVEIVSDIVSGRDISAAFDDQSMTEMDL